MNKSYRIHTNIGDNKVLKVDMSQEFDFLEILTMRIDQDETYRIDSSNYGIIVGRVLANDAFGIANAKVSIFIPIYLISNTLSLNDAFAKSSFVS